MGKDVVFRHVFVHMVAGHVAGVKKHDISGLKQAGVLPFPQIQVLQIIGGGDKGVLDIHDRDKGQVTAHRRLGNQAQVDLLLFQPGQGLGRGLALYGDLHVGILVNEGFKIGKQNIFAQCVAHTDPQVADVEFLNPLQFLLAPVQGVKCLPGMFK